MDAREYFEFVQDAARDRLEALCIRLYGKPHQIALGRSSDISDPTAQSFAAMQEADVVIESCNRVIQEAERVLHGVEILIPDGVRLAADLRMRYLELKTPAEVAKVLSIKQSWERELHIRALNLCDSVGIPRLLHSSGNSGNFTDAR